jgi:hypothetical protein
VEQKTFEKLSEKENKKTKKAEYLQTPEMARVPSLEAVNTM